MHAPTSLRQFYLTFFLPLRLRSRSPRTKALYETSLRNFDKFLGRAALLRDLDDLTVNGFLAWFRALGRSPYSVNKERSNLLAIWRFGCRERLIEKWPNVEAEREPQHIPMAWLDHEVNALFAACDKEGGWICGVSAPDFWKGILLVIWDSGQRIGAVMELHWADVDLKTGWVVFPAETVKGGRADDAHKLAQDTMIVLSRIAVARRSKPDGKVFAWPYTPNYLWVRYTRLLKAAGLPTDARSKFHRVRRSVASYFEFAGGDATKLLGHTDRKTTVRHYLDPRIVQDKQASDVLWRPDTPPLAG